MKWKSWAADFANVAAQELIKESGFRLTRGNKSSRKSNNSGTISRPAKSVPKS
jgi:hypothetical protein